MARTSTRPMVTSMITGASGRGGGAISRTGKGGAVSGRAAGFLDFGYGVQADGGFARAFRAVNFNNPALGDAPTQSQI